MLIGGCGGCMTDVTFWSYASKYPPICSKAMSLGMTWASLGCQCLAVLQMSLTVKPLFGPMTFLLIAAMLQGVCLLSVLAIERKLRCGTGLPLSASTSRSIVTDVNQSLLNNGDASSKTPSGSEPAKEVVGRVNEGTGSAEL